MSRFLLWFGILFFNQSVQAQTFNGTGGNIPDGGAQTCFPVNVSGVGVINGTYGLASVCLNITHTWVSDLEIYLQSPDGTLLPLSIQNGGSGINYTNTCFTATSTTSINFGTAPFTGIFLPEDDPLGVLNNGQNANGVWSLCIRDITAPDAGSLTSWSILFSNNPAPPPVVPVNDDACNAVQLTVGSSCIYSTYTNDLATSSTGVPAPGCSNYGGGDVWFRVTVPAGGALIFDTQNGAVTDGGMAIYSGTCTNLTLIACDDDGSLNPQMPKIIAGGLTPGSTVWIRFWDYGNTNPGTFGICVSPPPPPPANDNPCTATNLTVGNNSCNYQTFTTVNATGTTGVPAPVCSSYGGGDVWFTATVPAGGALVIDTQTGTITDGGMAVYTGTCNALTLVACDDDGSANGLMPLITTGGLTPGSTVWIRVWQYGNFSPGTFGICVSTPPPPPTNDNPCTAFPLAVNSICNFSTFTNTGSTGTTGVPNPGCGTYQGGDVWFTVTVPIGGSIMLNSNIGSMFDGAMAVYRGTCNALTLISCDDNSSLNPSMPFINLIGQVPGSTLWVRFWGVSTFNTGTFQICAAIPPPPTVQDCPAAIPICQNVYSETVSYSGTGNIPNEIDLSISCLGTGEKNDVWYTFTVQNSGNLSFLITPNTITEDYDWAVYNLTNANCSDIANNSALSVSCNYSLLGGTTGPTGASALTSQDENGTRYNALIPVVAGETYVINVSNFSSTANGYTINFGASTATIFDNVPPALQSISAASTCGGNQLGVNFSENILCSTVQNADFAVTGPGGPYTVTNWASASCSSGATYGNNIILTLNPAITTNGAFQICLTNVSGSVTDLCGNVAPPACFNFNISTTVPSFPPIGAICSGSTAPVLSGTSSNGITGTWSPSIVNNTTTGTYTFTPGAGQCAVPVTVTVTVTPAGTVPTFSSIAPICSGSAAPVLPTTSINGINGTWAPATVSNTTTGTYIFTPNAGQCATTTTLTVTVTSVVTSTTSETICNNELPFSWNGQTYPAAGTYSVTLTSSSGCDSIASLNLIVNPVVTSTTDTAICNNQLPFSWNGQTYPAAGAYLVTLTSNSGCDSIASLNLTLNPAVTSTTDTAICNNQLPFSWNGQTYPAAGTYSVTLTSSSGCDSIASINLTVNPAVTSTTDTAICNNQLSFSWNGQTFPAAGTYSVTLTSSSGCDSIASINLTVNPAVTSTTDTAICNNQLPFSWNGQTYPAAGTFSVTLTSSSGCDSIASINLTVNPAVTSTTDTAICNNQLPFSWNGQTYPAAGTYSVTLTSSSGCDSIALINLIVNPAVTSTTDTTICNNQLPFSWNGQTYPAAGTYSVTLTSSSGCDSIASLNLIVNSAVTSTTDTAICNNQLPLSWNGQTYPTAGTFSVTLTSSSGCDSIATLNLTANAVLTSTTDTAVCNNQLPFTWNGQTYPAAGTYSVTLTSSSGCDSIASLNLTLNPAVTSTTDTAICNNQLPFSWNGQTYPVAGTYSVTLTSSSGCDSIASLNLTLNPAVTSTTDTAICNNQLPFSWNGQTYPAAGTYSVTLTSSSGCDSIALLNLIVNPAVTSTTDTAVCNNQLPFSWNGQTYPAAGTYSVTLTSSSGCDSIASLNLTLNPAVTSTTDTAICNNQLPFSWNGQTYPAAGTYSVTLTSSSGCDSIASINLTVNPAVTSTTDTAICNNQLPFSWNGQTYPAAGTYSVTLTSNSGCDSIASLNLIVNPAVTSTTDTAVCNNQLPFTWNGQTYPAAGTYSVTLTSSSGCDSIASLNLIVNPAVTSTTDTAICNNQLPFSWNGQTYPAAGTYSVTLTSNSGCDSIATLNLTANAVLTSTTDTVICNNQLPFSWNGQTYSAAGTYSVTLTSNSGCDSIATLNLTANAVLTSITDTTICNNQLPFSWNGQTYPAAGTYSVTLTSSSGCDSIATLNLTANGVLTSTTDTSICNSQLPFSWNGQTYPTAGTYSVTLTSSSGCDSIATLNLTANAVLTSTTDTVICNNQLPFSWNGQTYPATGTYSVTLTSTSGCDSIATLNLTANAVLTSTTDSAICNNQLPFSWNGQTYPAAGTYSVTLISSAGCDSIATLNLTANAVLTSTIDTVICNNQLPFSWNGQTYPSAGTYSVTLTSSSGCDSIATLNLTANAVLTSTTDSAICNNQLPFSWNGQTYPAAGTYSVTLTSTSGCDSIATLNLTANAVLTSTTDSAICNNQLPFSWNGQTYPAAGTYSVTLISSAGCDSIATLNLTANAVLTSTTDSAICNNQLPFSWNGQTYPAAGTYSVTLISSAGCDSIATLNLTANAVLTSTIDTVICNNQLPFSWNGQTYPSAGTYSVTLTSSSGCDSIATLNLTANAVLTSTTDSAICNNQLPFSWNGQTYPAAGTYSVTLTSTSGCDSIATLNLTANAVLTSTTDSAICNNQLPFSWNGQTYPAAGTYSVTLISSAGCDSIATLNLTANAVLTSTIDTVICNNQLPFSWNGQTYPSAGTYSVTLTSSSGCDSIATLNLTANAVLTSTTDSAICNNQLPFSWNGQTYPAAGTYSVTLTSSSGCDSIATLNLTANAVLTSTTDTVICNNQLPFSWNGQTYPAAGTYSVTLTSSSGCDSIATLNLTANAVLTSTIDTVICNNQLPFSWNGQTYPSAGTYSVTLTSSSGCDSIATLNLTANAVLTSTTDSAICNNQLPFSWNGQTYPAAGTYSVTLTSSSGCDSIATLNLTANAVLTSTTDTVICNNQLPFSWNGQTYPAAGTYSVTLTSSSGCDSIATLNLTANAVLTSTIDTVICNNQLPFSWNGQTYPSAGTYSVTLTSSSGCDSIATLNLTANAVLTSTTDTVICNNQLPFSWNGQNYPSAGTYSVTLTSSSGCDSIATLNLTANAVLTSTTDTVICNNQLPFSWNGQNYPSAGTYSVTLVSSAGCDSIASLNLTVNPAATSTTGITICNNQLPYTWNGQTYSVAGNYSVILVSSVGCDSIARLNLEVNLISTSSTSIIICANQLPYIWNGQNLIMGGTFSDTLINISGCDSIAILQLTVNPLPTSISNAGICASQLPYIWNGQSYSTPGLHIVTLTSAAGCDSIATLNLVINNVTFSTSNLSTCDNQLPFIWNGQSYDTTGSYTITLTNSHGCDSIATLNLIINPVVASTTNTSICSSLLPYIWNGQSYTTTGIFLVTLTSSSRCDSIATLNLTVNPTPPAPSVVSPVIYCQHDIPSALIASGAGTLIWYTNPAGGTPSSSAPTPSTVSAGVTNYYVSQTNGLCEGPRAMITVIVNRKPQLGEDKQLKICTGSTANLTSLYNTGGFAANWSINQTSVINPVAVSIGGIYQLIVQNSSGCFDTARVILTIQPPVIAFAGVDDNAEYNMPYHLTGSGGVQYEWTPGSPLLNNPYIPNPVALLTQNTTFSLVVMDEIGCKGFDTVNIKVYKGPAIHVPTAFSPNGDGLNDIFRATSVGIQRLDYLRVYNRYAELIFETHDISKGWDGTYKGMKQNINNYVWTLKAVDRKGKTWEMKGNVVLIR